MLSSAVQVAGSDVKDAMREGPAMTARSCDRDVITGPALIPTLGPEAAACTAHRRQDFKGTSEGPVVSHFYEVSPDLLIRRVIGDPGELINKPKLKNEIRVTSLRWIGFEGSVIPVSDDFFDANNFKMVHRKRLNNGIFFGGAKSKSETRRHLSKERSSEKLNNEGSLFPYEINEHSRWKVIDRACPVQAELNKNTFFAFPMCPFTGGTPGSFNLQWQNESSNRALVSGLINKLNLNDSLGQPLAPPTKRHCRSLSEPDELSRCRSPWKPGNSKVWTPVSKRRCNSGGSATLQRCNSHGSTTLQRSTSVSLPQNAPSINNNIFTIPTCNTSPIPRPSSASSGFVDSSEGSTNSCIRWNSGGSCDFDPRRRLSLSQEHITEPGDVLPSANSTPTSTPELRRRQGLLRCRSQPCVLNERKTRLKRRRDEDVRWNRPSLDFFKMTRQQQHRFMWSIYGAHGSSCMNGLTDGDGSRSALSDVHHCFTESENLSLHMGKVE
ncbi:unnamed protein product [Ranitomeya imitator]|uniref:Protein FAM53A n=1 Tax=Ranitomeya imitator TaxID=111125 RepID=A0ABN9LHJ9_9NEOB|nr:unnamed protein product [Ranitomeya imitator]